MSEQQSPQPKLKDKTPDEINDELLNDIDYNAPFDFTKTLTDILQTNQTRFLNFLKFVQKTVEFISSENIKITDISREEIILMNEYVNYMIVNLNYDPRPFKQGLNFQKIKFKKPDKNSKFDDDKLESLLNMKMNMDETDVYSKNERYASEALYEKKDRLILIPITKMKNPDNSEYLLMQMKSASVNVLSIEERNNHIEIRINCRPNNFFARKKVIQLVKEYFHELVEKDYVIRDALDFNKQVAIFSSSKSTNFTIFKHLSKEGLTDYKSAKRFILRLFDDENDAYHFDKILKTIKENCKGRSIIQLDSQLTKRDPFVKHKDNEMTIYYSDYIVDQIKNGDFSTMFCDGTHLKQKKKHQLVLIRFHSSVNNKIYNVIYCIMLKKNSEAYAKMFDFAVKLGIVDKVKYFVSDFELAIKSGLCLALANNKMENKILFRFCYYHFVKNLRSRAASIKKVINKQKLKCDPPIPYLHVIFSFLYFIPKNMRKIFFYFMVGLCREINNSISNEVFFSYVQKFYVESHYADSLYANVSIFPVTTNNTVEGVNSSLKKFTAGNLTLESVYEWMLGNARSQITSCKTKVFKLKSYYMDFHEHISKEDYDGAIFDMIAYLSNFKSKKKSGVEKKEEKIRSKIAKNKSISKSTLRETKSLNRLAIMKKTMSGHFQIWDKLSRIKNVKFSENDCSFIEGDDMEVEKYYEFASFEIVIDPDNKKTFKLDD